jgi:hypothetical protein
MTQEEYFSKLNEIRQKQYEIERELQIDFAMANNPYKVGDIFKDHCGQIKIKMIKCIINPFGDKIPQCKYLGIEVKKDGTPFKSGSERWAYQMNEQH